VALLLVSLLAVRPALAQGEAGKAAAGGAAALFEKMCYSCHNIGGGDKKGPDLKDVTQRRKREWLHQFIPTPKARKNAGDATAVELFKKYAPEEMPDQMVSADQIDQILGLIEQYSKKPPFVPQSGKLARRPTPQDVPAGYRLFTGQTRLKNGGPACISCHSVEGVGLLGGGTLGFDLTQANVKYTEVELASILKAPAFPTMSKMFANRELDNEEVVRLFAYLQSARQRTPNPARSAAHTLIGSAAGVLVLLGAMNFTWKGRLRGVRKPLVRARRDG
jgi:mono/diheme cytochrome c family protein